MKILITGVDGYLGWPLSVHLAKRGHEVAGIDNYSRRRWVGEMGSQSAMPISPMADRLVAYLQSTGQSLRFFRGDLTNYNFTLNVFKSFRPDAIVYLGEMPSAPYSMIDVHHAVYTQTNNIMGTLVTLHAMRDASLKSHLVKLGTMGEYGTPSIDIPEGFFEIEYRGRNACLMFPRQAGSWYHQSKVHDSNNIEMACRIWGASSTDIMQGVVYGSRIDAIEGDDRLHTRFDFDQCFGTAINRFCAQAVLGMPLTPYGIGHQKRGFLSLRDSMQCITLAIENPPRDGEYRVFNQFEEVYDVSRLAEKVKVVAGTLGLDVSVIPIENPRIEAEQHYYNPDHQKLVDLGYSPTHDMDAELEIVLADLINYRARLEARKHVVTPDIRWDGARCQSQRLSMTPTVVDLEARQQ